MRFTVLLACLALFCAFSQPATTAAAPNRLVLALYYPWYDQNTWKDPLVPDRPPDRYRSSDPAVIARQIDQAQSAHIDGFISAWYGPGTEFNQTETNLRALLDLAGQRGFSVAAGVETVSPFLHSQADVQNTLTTLLNTHSTKPAYLKWNGKPVIFFMGTSLPLAPGQSTLAAWQSVRNQVDPGHRSTWIAEGLDMSLLDVFDGDFLYSVAWASDVGAAERQWAGRVRAQGGFWVGAVMPGWDDTRLVERPKRYARNRQNGEWYKAAWAGAASANPDWIVITSWNEFVENTHIEPSIAYGSQYLDLTRALAGAWKAGAPPVNPQPPAPVIAAAPPKPTNTPGPTAAAPAWQAPICSESVTSFCLVP